MVLDRRTTIKMENMMRKNITTEGEREGEKEREDREQREDKGEREQVAGHGAYGATSVPPYLGKINNLFGGVGENLKRGCNAVSRVAL